MGVAVLLVSGPVLWVGDLKKTKNGRSMRQVLVGLDRGEENPMPPCSVLAFGDDAEAVQKGDTFTAEGELELKLGDRDGKPSIRCSMMARRTMLSGLGGHWKRMLEEENKKAKAAEKATANGQATLALRDPPPFDDPIPF